MKRARWLAALDVASIISFVAIWGVVIGSLIGGLPVGICLLGFGAALLPGYLAADFASGLVHWFSDTFFAEDTPLLGTAVIGPFREHHRDPAAILRHGFVERTGNSGLATLPFGIAIVVIDPARAGETSGATIAAMVAAWAALFALLTNQLHCWAHAPEVPASVAWLQRRGWILAPSRHRHHHRGANDTDYCVASGWLNPLLDRLGFFRRLERLAGN